VRVLFKQLIINMMKIAILAFALFAAVVAEPEAEASPESWYGGYGYGGYGLGYGRGYYGGYYGGYGRGYYGGYGYGHGYYRGKRSADADAEASPALLYGGYHPYAYGAYHPYAYAPLRLAAGSSFQHVSTPAATYGIHQLHKRDAEADAEPEAYYGYGGYGGYPYAGYGYGRYYGYGRRYGYAGYGGYGYGRYGYYG